MVPTPVLFAESSCDTAQALIRAHIPFDLPNTTTSAAATQAQGQAKCSAEGDVPRETGSLLKDPRNVRKTGGGTAQFVD